MPSLSTKPNRFYPSIPAITEVSASHEAALHVIKEALETHERRNADYLKSFIRFEELVDLGIINTEGDFILDVSGVTEINDLTAAVVWANVPDANITLTSVNQHLAAISKASIEVDTLELQLVNDATSPGNSMHYGTSAGGVKGWYTIPTAGAEVNDLTAAVVWTNVPDANITVGSVTQHATALEGVMSHDDLVDFLAAEHVDWAVTGAEDIHADRFANSPAEVNDLSAAVTWVNVPNANITAGSVTQHEAALTILESQITDGSILARVAAAEVISGAYVFTATDVVPATLQSKLSRNMLYLDGKEAIDGSDAFLRLNQDGDFASGIFTPGNARFDGATLFAGGLANMTSGGELSAVSVSLADGDLARPTIEDFGITHQTPTVSANAVTVDLELGNSVAFDMDPATAAVVVTLSNPPPSGTYGAVNIAITMGTPAELITWPGSVVWIGGGGAPDLSTVNNDVDFVHLFTTDGGTIWYGTFQQAISAAVVLELDELSDVNTSTPTNRFVLVADGVDWESRLLVEADISNLGTYLTTEVNDLSAAVVWVNVPDANITVGSVTQHVASINHDLLLNFASNEHFTEASIDHTAITNIGTNTHAQIDTHLALVNEHLDWTADLGGTNLHVNNAANAVLALAAGEVTQLANIGATVISAADWTAVSNLSGINSGDQTSIVGITGTRAQFDTAVTDGNFAYAGLAYHDGFSDFVAQEHIRWDLTGAEDIHADRLSSGANMVDSILDQPVIRDFGLTHQTPTVSANAVTVDLTLGNSVNIDMDPATAAVVLTLSNPPASGTYGEVNIAITMGTPSHLITWPGSVVWIGGGGAPDLSTVNNDVDFVHLSTMDGGTIWYGSFLQAISSPTVLELNELSDVNTSTPTNRFVLVADGVDFESRLLVEADISNLQAYLTSFTETNDLSAAVTWVNVPDANITVGSVTQHVASINHDLLLNFASNEHFTEASIDHTAIANIGSNTHAQIDTHLGLTNEHLDWTADLGGTNLHANNSANAVLALAAGEVTQLANIGATVITAADWVAVAALVGINTGDQTSIVGITGTMAQFDTAVTDGNIAYAGGAYHDGFSDFVANEHLDWTAAQGANNLEQSNFGAGANFVDQLVIRAFLDDYAILHQVDTVSGNAVTVNLNNGNSHLIDLDPATADVTLTLTNPPASGRYGEVHLHIVMGTPAHGITWPGSVTWQGGSSPVLSLTNNDVDSVHLYTIDGGTNWFGTFATAISAALPTLAVVTAEGATTSDLVTFSGGIIVSGGTANLQDNYLIRAALDDYSIRSSSVGVVSNAVTITYSTSQSYEVDLLAATGNCTITISGGPPSGEYGEMIVKVKQDTVVRTLTWAGGTFEWPDGTAVVLTATASAFDIFHFSTWDSGTTWWGSAIQDVR